MNLTQCNAKINDSTGNYFDFNNSIVEDGKIDLYHDIKPNITKKEHGNKLRKKSRSSYMCRKCRAHGQLLAVKDHRRNCPFKICPCPLCSVVSHGREIVARQIRLYRNQKEEKKNVPQSPHCRRCRNHGEHNAWKGHKKKCRHSNCPCKLCLLITMRKTNEKSYREIIQETVEDKGIIFSSKNSNSAFSLSSRTKDRSLSDEQSNFLRNLNRSAGLSTACSSLYEGNPNNSTYTQNAMLNFQHSENCQIRSLNWTPSTYKVGLQPWENANSFDVNGPFYCGNSQLNNVMIGSHNVFQNSSNEYMLTAPSSWYPNVY